MRCHKSIGAGPVSTGESGADAALAGAMLESVGVTSAGAGGGPTGIDAETADSDGEAGGGTA